jgi:hypothetical protein
LAIIVLPQPGGPYNSTPLGGVSWCSQGREGAESRAAPLPGDEAKFLVFAGTIVERRCRRRVIHSVDTIEPVGLCESDP